MSGVEFDNCVFRHIVSVQNTEGEDEYTYVSTEFISCNIV